MTGEALVTGSQVVWQLAAWPVVALLIGSAVRRRVPLVPALAVVLLVASFAAGTLWPGSALLDTGWFVTFPLLCATYPDGRFTPRWLLAPVLLLITIATADLILGGRLSDGGWWLTVPVLHLALLGAQVYRYRRRATTAERERARWAILGTLVCVELFGVLYVAEGGSIGTDGPWSVAAANLAGLPAAAGFAIGLLRPGLAAVDVMLRAVLRFTGVVLVLAPLFGAVTALAAWAGAGEGAAWWGAAILGAATAPVVRLAGLLADWVVYRGRADPATAVARLGAALDAQPDATAVPATVLQAITDAVYLDAAELRGGAHLSAAVGRLGPGAVAFPVIYQGEELATLHVDPRRGESELTARDRTVITQLAVHAAPALHGARALADLTETHARLVHSREEERRRLRRDLHDDLSPSLAGLALSAAAVARRASGVDDGLAGLAEELHRDIKAAVAQTREIAYGLRPEILDDRGLVAAIQHRTAGAQADRLEVSVRAPEPHLDLPAAVDLAALRIVQEAVTNVRRHAGARVCEISIAVAAGHLEVIVRDDGDGFPERISPGLGLASIRERASELGGTVRLGRAPQGGGEVAVRLPLPPAVPA